MTKRGELYASEEERHRRHTNIMFRSEDCEKLLAITTDLFSAVSSKKTATRRALFVKDLFFWPRDKELVFQAYSDAQRHNKFNPLPLL